MNYVFGILGIVVLLGIAFLFSEKKRGINWRTVGGALLIQLAFGFIVLRWSTGRAILNGISKGVDKIISYANEGVKFVFGSAIPVDGFVFAFQVLTIIIFFSALISVLYYLHIMTWVIRFIGGGLSKFLKTSKAESLSATANIFVGQVEAPLVVRPYLNSMTRSEIFTVMTGGMASVSGSVLAGYALMGVPLEYLIAASFMSAPAGLLVSKLLIPETEKHEEQNIEVEEVSKSANVVDAAAGGAVDGLQIALAVGATLIAFIGLIALLNGILGGIGGWFGHPEFSLQGILGLIFSPIAYIIGVPLNEASIAGSLIGQKIILNEFVAFSSLAQLKDAITPRTLMITSFALCGFANLGSIAIQISGLSSMAPDRRKLITQLGFRSVLAGTIANLLSASIAGMFYVL
ncbi:NupC/NupG family nucleoside CNT transporter [Paenibacillus marinisediminis]